MDQIETLTEELAKAIQESGDYRQFCAARDELAKDPELRARINEFRRHVFEVQNSPESSDMYKEMERIGRDYEEFRENPLVEDFLQGELRVCRIIQQITKKITEAVDLDTKDVTAGMTL